MKRLQLVRKKLLPLLLCVAVAGNQVPVMAADVEGFSDSAEGFNEEWSEDTKIHRRSRRKQRIRRRPQKGIPQRTPVSRMNRPRILQRQPTGIPRI